MPKLLTHVLLLRPQSGRILIGMVAGFTSERWPASGWNARPDNVGIRKHAVNATVSRQAKIISKPFNLMHPLVQDRDNTDVAVR